MMTITFTWWLLPTIITVVGILWATLWVGRNDNSVFAGVEKMLALVPVLIISCIAWIIAGAYK